MIRFTNSLIPMGRDKRLKVNNLTLDSGEFWVISGKGGSGKSSLARVIAGVPDKAGYLAPIRGLTRSHPHGEKDGAAWISFDREKEIREELRHNDDSEVLGRPDEGTVLDDFLGGTNGRRYLNPELLEKLEGRGIRHLSTGEFRQVFIAREAGKGPPLAVLDEPFEGLDVQARPRLLKMISQWSESGILIVLTVNRMEDIPDNITGLIRLNLNGGNFTVSVTKSRDSAGMERVKEFSADEIPEIMSAVPPPITPVEISSDTLIQMRDVSLSFNGRSVLKDINWTVWPGESWIVTGPNGSGKTTLLNLISGDEPRGYGEDITLFGKRKGSGETTSEIKKKIGQVSASIQESVPRFLKPIEVIGSGLRDTLVLTGELDGVEYRLAERWLEILGLKEEKDTVFSHLSYGARRLTLIGRAMIKHPPLLMLDEPMHGLDSSSRIRVRKLIDLLIRETETSVLYVSHRIEDAPDSIRKQLKLVPDINPGSEKGASRAELHEI